MKVQYKILLSIILAEFFIFSILERNNIKVQSWIGNAIGVFVFILPIQILFYLLYKDEKQSRRKRKFFRIAFWFINICYVSGGVATIITAIAK